MKGSSGPKSFRDSRNGPMVQIMEWIINCILPCLNKQGKKNYHLWLLRIRKISSLITMKAKQVIYVTVIQ